MLAPVLVMAVVALALYLLRLAPGHMQCPEAGVREYNSIEEAESELGFDIAVPAYFPSYFSWPPAGIYVQREPAPMVHRCFSFLRSSIPKHC